MPLRAPHAWAFALDSAGPWLEALLARGDTLHAWAGVQPDRRELAGRGAVYSVAAPTRGPDARARWVVRHYYRGGAVARYLDDRYLSLGRPRPLVEACAALEARGRGILTPAAVAGAVYPAGAFYRADLVTEEIPDASDLAAVLFGEGAGGVDASASLTAAGRLVRTLERAGLFHPDMNAKNIVLRSGTGGVEAHLVDLDRCCVRETGVPAPRRHATAPGAFAAEVRTAYRAAAVGGAVEALRAGWQEAR